MPARTDAPVLVLGATGTTGSRVVRRLRAAGAATRPASRSGATRFAWSKPATWRPAVTGARAVYLIDQGASDADAVASFASVAAAEGVATIVLLSSREAELPLADYRKHLASEHAVQAAGTGWTILRPSWFAQNFMTHFDREVRAGLLQLPAGEGRDPFIDAEDIAEVAEVALTEDGHHGRTYDLSGPRALSYRDAIARITALTGLSVRYEAITEAAYVAQMTARGVPEELAWSFAANHRPIAMGHNDHVSDGVDRVLGRSPRDFDDVVRTAVAEDIWPPA